MSDRERGFGRTRFKPPRLEAPGTLANLTLYLSFSFFFLFGFLGCRRGPERTRARAHLSYGEAPGVRSGKR